MATTIKLKNGSGAPTAGQLVQGEPALDLTNKRLYTEDSVGTVIEVGTNPTNLTTGGLTVNASQATISNDGSNYLLVERTTAGTEGRLFMGVTSSKNQIVSYSGTSGTAGKDLTIEQGNAIGKAVTVHANNDISFYEDTGTTAKFFWDASAESLGIGTSSPNRPVHLGGAGSRNYFKAETTALTSGDEAGLDIKTGTAQWLVHSKGDAKDLIFYDAASVAERLRIDSSGNVGIGTTSPTHDLDVAGVIKSRLGSGGLSMSGYSTPDLGYFAYNYFNDNGTETVGQSVRSSHRITMGNGGTNAITFDYRAANAAAGTWSERMRIDSAGNVGINLTQPNANLDVLNEATIRYSDNNPYCLQLRNDVASGGNSYISALGTSSSLVFNTSNGSNTQVRGMTIDSLGNVSVGSAHSTNALDGVKGLQIGHNTETSAGLALETNQRGYLLYINGTDLRFWDSSSNAERASIDISGNFYVGVNSSSYFSRLGGNGSGVYTSNGNAADTGVSYWAKSYRGADTGRQFLYFQYSNTGLAFQVFNNGNVENLNNSYGALSDRKLKDNIAPASSQWDDIKAIEVCSYNLKSTGEKHIGVIAQQLEEVGQNGLVSEFTERDENGELTEETTKTVKYSVLYMKAIKALQEAMTRIETLEAEVSALKGA